MSSLFLLPFSNAYAEVLIQDDFNDGVIDSSKWIISGHDVIEHQGMMDLQANATDNVGFAKTVEFKATNKIKLEVEHTMHAGGSYFFPAFVFYSSASTTGGGNPDGKSFQIRWQKSDYYEDYCNNRDYYNKIQILSSDMPCSGTSITSSSFYDKKIKSVITYDASTGTVNLDIDGDGSIDASMIQPEGKRFPVKQILISPYGWWTGHYHQIDSFKLESLDDAKPQTADLNMSISAPSSVSLNQKNTYTFTINNSSKITAKGVKANFVVPRKAFATVEIPQNCTLNGRVLECKLADLNAGQSATQTLSMIMLKKGALSVVGLVNSSDDDANYDDNKVSAVVSVK